MSEKARDAMTRPEPRRRGPVRALDALGALWSSATTLPPLAAGAGATYRTLFLTVRRLTLGRRVTVRYDGGDLQLTVERFDSPLDLRRLAGGRLSDVQLVARDISWRHDDFEAGGMSTGGEFSTATVRLRNLWVRPGPRPEVIATPIELTVNVPGATVDGLLAQFAPRLTVEVDADGVARVARVRRRRPRRPGWWHAEAAVELSGTRLHIRPVALVAGRWRCRLPARTPGYRTRIPQLPHDLRITGVRCGPGMLQVSGVVPHWRLDVSRSGVEVLLHQLNSAGLLVLSRSSRRS